MGIQTQLSLNRTMAPNGLVIVYKQSIVLKRQTIYTILQILLLGLKTIVVSIKNTPNNILFFSQFQKLNPKRIKVFNL